MVNASHALDLEGLHREMHGIAEQIRIMNENNSRLIQHLTTNNPPPLVVAPIQEEPDRSRHSCRSNDRDSQTHQSTGRAHSIRIKGCRSPNLLSRRDRSSTPLES